MQCMGHGIGPKGWFNNGWQSPDARFRHPWNPLGPGLGGQVQWNIGFLEHKKKMCEALKVVILHNSDECLELERL